MMGKIVSANMAGRVSQGATGLTSSSILCHEQDHKMVMKSTLVIETTLNFILRNILLGVALN